MEHKRVALTNSGQELPDVSCEIPIHDLPVEYVLERRASIRTPKCPPQFFPVWKTWPAKAPVSRLPLTICNCRLGLPTFCKMAAARGKAEETAMRLRNVWTKED